ncbi:hypothetical protein L596_002353 [Steinernema carpocapsae]|uniref:Uncharacterized protein n=1 Tax=Steinernema carpocapsae TaxID=34508 RepID=A0A4U8UP21_STECR|nr:hypothetical protein L596_002353 [Steinernema carpocapsae]
MKVWNEFITLDEVDQQRILDDIDSKHPEKEVKKSKKTKKAKADHGPSSSNSSDDARRAHHPAFSGKACFKRMERRFKDLMLQKHLPWSFISATEQALVDFFNCDPNGVWVGTLLNPNHRLYLHAVAQYLSLFSESTTDSTDQRVTEVRNTRDNFVSPNITLLEYVSEQKKKRKSKAVE